MKQETLTIDKICSLAQENEYEVYLLKGYDRLKENNEALWDALWNILPSGAEMVVYTQPVPKPKPPVTAEVIVDGRTYRLVEES